jgi:hypothetical protein
MWTKIKALFGAVNWTRTGIIAVIVTALLGWYSAWVYNKGRSAATIVCASDTIKATDKSEKIHAKIEIETYSLPSGALDDEYSRWLR